MEWRKHPNTLGKNTGWLHSTVDSVSDCRHRSREVRIPARPHYLTLVVLSTGMYTAFANNVDPDQLASMICTVCH